MKMQKKKEKERRGSKREKKRRRKEQKEAKFVMPKEQFYKLRSSYLVML